MTGFVHEVDAEQGRVKVEYRGDRGRPALDVGADRGAAERRQARTALHARSGRRGLVAFEDGDFDHPFVVGFLWNGKHDSPETEASNRVIVTPGGHQLRFEDKEDDTRVILRSNGKHELLLEDKAERSARHVEDERRPRGPARRQPDGIGKVEITSGQHKVTLDDAPASDAGSTIDAGMGVVTISLNVDARRPSLAISVARQHDRHRRRPASSVSAAGALIGRRRTAAPATINAGRRRSGRPRPVLTVNAGVATFSGVVIAPHARRRRPSSAPTLHAGRRATCM